MTAALTHLHRLVYPFLQPQWISSWHATDASEIAFQRGSQPVLVFLHPQFAGSGSSCIGVKALFQQIESSSFNMLFEYFTSWQQILETSGFLCEQVFPTIINSHAIICMII